MATPRCTLQVRDSKSQILQRHRVHAESMEEIQLEYLRSVEFDLVGIIICFIGKSTNDL